MSLLGSFLSSTSGGGGGITPYVSTFTNQNSITVTHNFGRLAQAIQVYDVDGNLINGVGINNDNVNYFTIYCESPLTISGSVNYL